MDYQNAYPPQSPPIQYQIENEKLTDQLKMTKKASGEAERRFFFKQEQLQKEIGTLKTYLAGRDSANNGESLDVAKMQVEIETLKEERDVLIRRAEEREVVMKGEVVKLNALLHEAEEHLRRERVEASSRFSISKEEYGKMVDSYENRILEMSLELDSLTTNNGGVGQSDLGAATYSSSRPKKVGSKLSNKRGAASADTNTSSQELQQKISSLKRMLDNQKIEYEEKLQFVRDEVREY